MTIDEAKKNLIAYAYSVAEDIPSAVAQALDTVIKAVDRARWIPVSERPPEERDSIFAKFKGTDKWKNGMFEKTSGTVIVTACSNDGSYRTTAAHTNDGKWKINTFLHEEKVVAWMPLPEPYHVADSGKKEGEDE